MGTKYLRGLSNDKFKEVLDECIKKVEGGTEKDWQDIVEQFDLGIHRDVLRKAFQSPIGGYSVYKYLEDNRVNNITDNELIKQIENKTLELEKTKIQCQDQKREYKKLIRPQARFERLVEVLEGGIKELNNIKPFTYKEGIYSVGKNEAVLMASDWHIDARFDNCLGKYNQSIAKERIDDLLHKTIEYCKVHKVNTLHLELLGDNISGGIHWSSKVESEEDMVSQIMTLCEILASFITELANNIPNVKIYSCVGNHSRINMSKSDNQEGENLERLVPFYLKARLKDIENAKIMDECNLDDGIIMFDVLNTKIIGVHGDLDNPSNVVDNMIKMFRVFPDQIDMGHRHHHYEKEEYEIEVSINGCLQGTDTYSKNIRKSGRPMQKLSIYNEEGKLCSYKIKL